MDAPGHGHVYEEDAQRTGLHSVTGGGEEENHEKKSILKKVKDKAKRIKNTISKKRPGHGEERRHGEEEEDEDEDEEEVYVEDEEGEQEPDVHGAPMYESEAARDFVSRTPEEGPEMKERPHLASAGAGRWEEETAAAKVGTGEPVPGTGSYQTTVTDSSSSGGPDTGVIRSLQALSVSDQPEKAKEEEKKEDAPPTASGVREFEEKTPPVSEEAELERSEAEEQQPLTDKGYTEKISSVASAISDKAAYAEAAAVSAAVGSAQYGKKMVEALYEKVAGAGSAVVSTVSHQQQQHPEKKEPAVSAAAESASAGKAKRVSMREYLAEKLRPGEEDRALVEVISEVMQKKRDEERDVRDEAEEKTATESLSGAKKAGELVVVKIKGAVTSLFGGTHAAPPQAREAEALDTSRVEQGGGRRPQESRN